MKTTCLLCSAAIGPENDSREHIIPNAVGGRRRVRGLLCRSCNSGAGNTWDAELARQLNPLSLMLGVSRQEGAPAPQNVLTTEGERLTIRSDGRLQMSAPSIIRTEVDGRTAYKIQARSEAEARSIVRRLESKRGAIDVEAAMASMIVERSPPRGMVQQSLTFGGEVSGRSIIKSAVALAYSAGIDWSLLDDAVAYLRTAHASPPFGYYYETDLIQERPVGTPLHCVVINADGATGVVLAYAEYFGIYRTVMCLGSGYFGPPVEAVYAIDSRSGDQLDLKIELSFSRSEMDRIYGYEAYDSDAQLRAIEAVLNEWAVRHAQEERDREIGRAVELGLSGCGAKEGEDLTDEHLQRLSRIVGQELTPFILRNLVKAARRASS